MIKALTRWFRRDKFSAKHLNETVDLLQKINPISGAGQALVQQGFRGTSINVPKTVQARPAFRAVIKQWMGNQSEGGVQTGVGLYEAKLVREIQTAVAPDESLESVSATDKMPDDPDIIVWNEAEADNIYGGWIDKEEVVVVYPTLAWSDEAHPRKVYRTFVQEPPDVLVRIDDDDLGNAQYTGVLLGGLAEDIETDVHFEMPSDLIDGNAALICNVDEQGLTGHRLKNPSFLPGKYKGMTPDNKAIVLVHGGVGRTDSPMDIVSGGLVPDSLTTWNRDTGGTDSAGTNLGIVPFHLKWWGKVSWDPDTNSFIQNYQWITVDTRGFWYAIDGENYEEITDTNPCP